MRIPVAPPRPDGLWVCENEEVVERAAGVAEFSGVIQVSVRARKWRVMSDVQAEMDAAFLTADWKFQSPPITLRSV